MLCRQDPATPWQAKELEKFTQQRESDKFRVKLEIDTKDDSSQSLNFKNGCKEQKGETDCADLGIRYQDIELRKLTN